MEKQQSKDPAFLDDLAYLVDALIRLQEVTGDTQRLDQASELVTYLVDHFSDEESLFFYYTKMGQSDVIVRKKEVYDGATPSGNAVMGHNLLYLSVVFDKSEWRDRAAQMVSSLGQVIIKYPTSFGVWASLLQASTKGLPEIVVTAQKIVDWRKQILAIFIPYKIFQSTERPDDRFPLLRNKVVATQPFIYLCKNYVCHHPENDLQRFIRLLETV